ncbi:MAG TPA: hypothetical protein VH814_23220 [Steroidobacteraceae bacterium]|jgi:hypothetical protein
METRWIIACVGALLWSGALADSEIYCEVSIASFAWGPSYGGTAIAPDGTVARFEYDFMKNPGARDGMFDENWLSPTRRDLVQRFAPGRRAVGSICADRRTWVRDQLGIVSTAGRSKVVDMQSRDGPTVHTRCFVFEAGRDTGKVVMLQEAGDAETHSLSPAAPRLANWLNAVAAEAQRRAKLPDKERSCIDPPPLTAPIYPDGYKDRQRAMAELKAAQQLHCQFAYGNGTNLDGEQRGNFDSPAKLSVLFSDLHSTTGRGEMFGNSYAVRIGTDIAGLVLTNLDAEKNHESDVVTVVPFRVGGREVYPAVKHEIRLHIEGGTTVRYSGQCVPLAKAL